MIDFKCRSYPCLSVVCLAYLGTARKNGCPPVAVVITCVSAAEHLRVSACVLSYQHSVLVLRQRVTDFCKPSRPCVDRSSKTRQEDFTLIPVNEFLSDV